MMTPPDLTGADVAAGFAVQTDPQQYNFSGQEMKCLRGVQKNSSSSYEVQIANKDSLSPHLLFYVHKQQAHSQVLSLYLVGLCCRCSMNLISRHGHVIHNKFGWCVTKQCL